MSERKAEPFEVRVTTEDMIEIVQPAFGDDESIVLIHPDQIELLQAWLFAARRQIKNDLKERDG